jgi:glycosyltransferase involved in cell wall biosynthesis
MRLHVVSLPHTQTTEDYLTCAYTQKIVKFAPMMMALGHEVIIYGGEENTAPCTEFVPIVTKKMSDRWFGKHDVNRFFPITWVPDDLHWRSMNKRAIPAIKKRQTGYENDVLCLIAGNCQQTIYDKFFPTMIGCEFGVGYEGIFSPYCAFESKAWQHYVYGKRGFVDGRWYDTVIPNYFDAKQFHTSTLAAKRKDEYLLYLGRIIERKGVEVAVQIADRAGMTLKIAGNGAEFVPPNIVQSNEITLTSDFIEYVGPVGIKERAALMAGATATIMPTYYIEPFGGVAVESMLSGTPVIASPWGAFSETVLSGISGETFTTLQKGVDAIDKVRSIKPAELRKHAVERYSLEAVGPMYERWFTQLLGLWGVGWDA